MSQRGRKHGLHPVSYTHLILGLMARSGANLLTVNQSIPMRGMASVTISARTGEMKYSSEELVHRAEAMEGVSKVEILASE